MTCQEKRKATLKKKYCPQTEREYYCCSTYHYLEEPEKQAENMFVSFLVQENLPHGKFPVAVIHEQ